MLPPRDHGQRCPNCKSPHLLKFGYEWQCESMDAACRAVLVAGRVRGLLGDGK
jgi:hypothetical protein